jgi:hypothetical protein
MGLHLFNECTACRSPRREDLDADLQRGCTIKECAAKFGISKSVIGRHKLHHVGSIGRRVIQVWNGRAEVIGILLSQYGMAGKEPCEELPFEQIDSKDFIVETRFRVTRR